MLLFLNLIGAVLILTYEVETLWEVKKKDLTPQRYIRHLTPTEIFKWKYPQTCEGQGRSDLMMVLNAKQGTGSTTHAWSEGHLIILMRLFFQAVLAEGSIDERVYMLLKLSDLTEIIPAATESISRNVSYFGNL